MRNITHVHSDQQLPRGALLLLAMTAFITILTEALPAGLLPQMAQSLQVPESYIGQTITIYALGSLLTAIPLTNMTQQVRRRPLLLSALLGFLIANTVTTFSTDYRLTMLARFLAGMSAGLLWALLVGYASRMAPAHLKGRAIAIAMLGAPLALSLGVPIGTYLGNIIGWQMTFGMMSILALVLLLFCQFILPDFSSQTTAQRLSLKQVFYIPGVRPILMTVLGFVLAHNILYTYIAPFLASVNMLERTDLSLFIFGSTSLIGIWVVGVWIDRYLRVLMLSSIMLFGLTAFIFGLMSNIPVVLYCAIALWGLAYGGAPTLLQTALANAAEDAADVAQSMLVTAWNIAIAGGGIIGGILLDGFGVIAFSPAVLLLLLITLLVVWTAKGHGFPRSVD